MKKETFLTKWNIADTEDLAQLFRRVMAAYNNTPIELREEFREDFKYAQL